jgi:hypothetical protein
VAISSLQDNLRYKALMHAIAANLWNDCRNLTGRGKNARLDRATFRSPKNNESSCCQHEGDGGPVLSSYWQGIADPTPMTT